MVSETTIRRRIAAGWTPEQAAAAPARNLPADLTGRRFGKLTPLRIIGRLGPAGRRHIIWLCQCDCGNTSDVTANNLRNGSTTTCGCRLENLKAHGLTHGHVRRGRGTPTYMSWIAMLARCYYAKGVKYSYYGGRGITVCESWRNSFEEFLADMGERPAGRTLDRINVNGHYTLENCRWATRTEQNRNRRRVSNDPI